MNPGYSGLVTAIRGWATQPSLIEFENVLANQESLDNQKSGGSVKDEEKALFGNKKSNKGGDKTSESSNHHGKSNRKPRGYRRGPRRGGFHRGGAREDKQQDEKVQGRREVVCYNCKKKGHFARNCWSKSVEGNSATSAEHESRSEKEWDLQASYAMEESSFAQELDHEDRAFDMEVKFSNNAEQKEAALVMTNDKVINYKDDWVIDSG